MKLAKCPLCGEPPQLSRIYGHENLLFYGGCEFAGAPAETKAQAARNWNRLVRLVRKGRMFEWAERTNDWRWKWQSVKRNARDWWRKRRKK